MTMTEMLTRMRTALAEALFFPMYPPSAEHASDALQEVTRWAWLPPLSGVAVAADAAYNTRENAIGKAVEQAENTQ